jgi:AraC-like DNA-binding protein
VLHRVRDWIDREYARSLNLEALAGGVHMSAGHLSRAGARIFGEMANRMTKKDHAIRAALRR